MNCPSCNAEIADSAKFCPECGEKIIRKTLCPGCGAEVTPGAKFCPECGEKIVRKNEDDGAYFIECPTNSDLVANAGTPTAIKIPRNVPSGYDYKDGGYFFTIRAQLKNESAHDAASLDIDLVFFKKDASGHIEERYSVAHTLVPGRQLRACETRKFEFKDLILDENPPTGTGIPSQGKNYLRLRLCGRGDGPCDGTCNPFNEAHPLKAGNRVSILQITERNYNDELPFLQH